ncbi:MAG: hypothetical protein ACYDD6_07365, partial [Acidimicrobiales bacterium]
MTSSRAEVAAAEPPGDPDAVLGALGVLLADGVAAAVPGWVQAGVAGVLGAWQEAGGALAP